MLHLKEKIEGIHKSIKGIFTDAQETWGIKANHHPFDIKYMFLPIPKGEEVILLWRDGIAGRTDGLPVGPLEEIIQSGLVTQNFDALKEELCIELIVNDNYTFIKGAKLGIGHVGKVLEPEKWAKIRSPKKHHVLNLQDFSEIIVVDSESPELIQAFRERNVFSPWGIETVGLIGIPQLPFLRQRRVSYIHV